MFQRMGSVFVAIAITFFPLTTMGFERVKKIEADFLKDAWEQDDDVYISMLLFWAKLPFTIPRKYYQALEYSSATIGTLQWGFGDIFIEKFFS